jgi:predicted CXXCH cytochrome family protein
MVLRTVIMILMSTLVASAAAAGPPTLSIVYPKPNSVVGGKVNLVLDPASDWSAAPYFQAVVNGKASEVIDTSTGRHALQGLDLQPGMNAITVKVLVPAHAGKSDESKGKELKKEFKEVFTRHLIVFSKVELFTGRTSPAGYAPELFHTRENEAACSGCHQLDTSSSATFPKKPEEAICYACHRSIPTGQHIHGPAAVWHCLSCHNPELYPVKYQFTAVYPSKVSKSVQPIVPRAADPKIPVVRSITIRDTCLKCHSDVMSGPFKHGPIDAGYCTLCHDPHASENAAWLRKPSWDLCTTCHDEKITERHVIVSQKNDAGHPTKNKRDPARRGKRMTCVSCHAPHSAESRYLYAFGAKERFALCGFCHGKK